MSILPTAVRMMSLLLAAKEITALRTSDVGMFPTFEGPLSSSSLGKQGSWEEARVSSGWAVLGAGLPCWACWLHVWIKRNEELGCSVWLAGANTRLSRPECTCGFAPRHGALPPPHRNKLPKTGLLKKSCSVYNN